MVRRTKEEAQETRRRILRAAEDVFFERGVAHSTLDHVARAAGVTRGAIYWHFQNKLDLFSALHEEVRMPMMDVFYRIVESDDPEGDALARLEDFCIASLVDLHDDDRLRRLYTVLMLKCELSDGMAALAERQQASKREIVGALSEFLARAQTAGRLATCVSPRILATGLYAYMCGLYRDYLGYVDSYDMPDDARALVSLYFAPLRREATPAGAAAHRRPAATAMEASRRI